MPVDFLMLAQPPDMDQPVRWLSCLNVGFASKSGTPASAARMPGVGPPRHLAAPKMSVG